MKEQKKLVIPDELFRLMVKWLPFSDMVRLEAFNQGKKAHIVSPLNLAIILTPWALAMPNQLWAGIWTGLAIVVALCCRSISLKENDRWSQFQKIVEKVEQLETTFSVDREWFLDTILEQHVKVELVALTRKIQKVEASLRELSDEDEDDERRKPLLGSLKKQLSGEFEWKFDVAKAVFGNQLDDGKGYGPFFGGTKPQTKRK